MPPAAQVPRAHQRDDATSQHLNTVLVAEVPGESKEGTALVLVESEPKGFANFNADITAALNFKSERSASALHNVLDKIEIPDTGDNHATVVMFTESPPRGHTAGLNARELERHRPREWQTVV